MARQARTPVPYREKIIVLWIVFLLGLLFHTDLGLMPLFHGLDVAEFQGQRQAEVTPIFWAMLVFFGLPMGAIVTSLFTDSRRYRRAHLGLTGVYTVLNIGHLLADLMVRSILWYQVFLMVILVVIGLLLNLVSLQWLQEWARPSGGK